MKHRASCGIDVGTQGVRVVLMDPDGQLLGTGEAPLRSARRAGVRHEQDPEAWWQALVTAVREALARAGDVDLLGVALDATSGTVLLERPDGAPAGPALMYDDGRAGEQAARAQQVGEPLWSALGYRIQASWGLPKALWLLAEGHLSAGDRVVHQSDHLVRRLVGHPVPTDTSHALKTGADLRDATWPAAVFAELGLDPARLPELARPGTVVGGIGAAAAAETGLAAGTPVRLGMTDGCASQIAAGALAPGSWSSTLGTTLVLKGSTRELVRDPSGAVYSHRHPDGGWLPGGASSTGAGVLGVAFPDAGPEQLDALTREAAGLGPVPGVTYPLAGTGERFPFVAPAATGFTSPAADTPARRFAALCQGVAFVERLAFDVLGHLGADVAGPVALTGGATRNRWWNQLRTDVLGRPTWVPASAQPAGGMAILAVAEPGALTATAGRMVRVADRYEPDAGRGAQLHAGYRALVADLLERGWLPAGAVPATGGPW